MTQIIVVSVCFSQPARIMSTRPQFLCLVCNKSFQTKGSLKHHENNIHKSIKVGCQDCGKQFTHKFNLRRHISSVHKGIKYKCDQCDKEFTLSVSRNNHVKSVHDQKKYPCSLCDYQAKQQCHLTLHAPCTICGYKASTQGSLIKHIQSQHKGGKTYQCKSCDKEYTNPSGLKNSSVILNQYMKV